MERLAATISNSGPHGCRYRLGVRTRGSQPRDRGSNPRTGTRKVQSKSVTESAGLRLKHIHSELLRADANVKDTFYDPRTGLGRLYHWVPRDIAAYCARHGIRPQVHFSVAERIARGTDDYAPGSISPDASIVTTPTWDLQA